MPMSDLAATLPPQPGPRPADVALMAAWLRKSVGTLKTWKMAAGIGSLLSGLLILFISFWVTFDVLWFISHSFYPLKNRVLLLIAGAFMVVVGIVGAKQNRESLEPLERQVKLAEEMDITLSPYNRYGMSYTTNAMSAGAFEVRSMASVVNYILCGGVLLVMGSVRNLRQYQELQRLDMNSCARVIALLFSAGKRQSFAEILEKLPGLNHVRVFDDLRWIEGVHFLASEPPGLVLLPELKEEIAGFARAGV